MPQPFYTGVRLSARGRVTCGCHPLLRPQTIRLSVRRDYRSAPSVPCLPEQWITMFEKPLTFRKLSDTDRVHAPVHRGLCASNGERLVLSARCGGVSPHWLCRDPG